MTIDAFLESAWSDHADQPQEVADRVATSLHVVEAPADFPPFVDLLVHVYGEHLGLWQRGVELLESLRRLPAFDGSAVTAGSIVRGVAVLRYASGAPAALGDLSAEDQVRALATASSALVGREENARAIVAFTEAVRSAAAGLPAGSPANRALAIGGNNLAGALEGKRDRVAAETEAMVAAAETGLKYWKLAGTWLEEERAEYRLTRSLLEAGEPLAAIESAKRCLAVCEKHDAPPFEQFFAHAAVALAHRAAGDTVLFETHHGIATSQLEQIPEAERQWCKSELEELQR
jgi:hypothetical protein